MKVGSLVGRNVKGQTVKSVILHNADGSEVTLEMKTVNQLIRDKGMDAGGDAQRFHTMNVLRRIKRYMPFRQGVTYKLTMIQTNVKKPEIITDTPYAKYLFYGKVMVDPKTNAAGFLTTEGWRSRKGIVKVRTSRNLEIFKGKNPNAGPRWDKALSAAEGKAMAADLQRYMSRRSQK